MPAPRSSSSAGDRSNTVTSCPASASTHAAVKPPSDPPTTAMSTLRSGLTEGGDLIDRALEQHAPLVDRGVTQAVWTGLLCVLRPDLVDVCSDSRALSGIVLGDLACDRVLDADPVIGIRRVDEKARQPRVLADPAGLGAMRRTVDQYEVAFVVEPHRRQVGPTTRADDAEHLCDRIVQQLLVRRLEIAERADRGAITDCELARLRAARDIAELGNFDAQGRTPFTRACGRS